MCGRTACTLSPQQLCKACSGNKNRRYQNPAKWRAVPGHVGEYSPRFNFPPSVYGPILVAGHHFVPKDEADDDNGESSEKPNKDEDDNFTVDDLVIQPMQWGLIPSYHKGEPKEFRYKTINARAEDIMEKLFRVPLKKGKRCVVLADGFYEWKREREGKQPYFIYFPQDHQIEWDHPEKENGGEEWTGRRVMTMAGLFDVNHNAEYPMYSYTIITVDASKKLSWMHNRMPALLDNDEAVDKWLDSESVSWEEALTLLKPVENVCYHSVPVSMGNIRNQGPECILPQLQKKKESGSGIPGAMKTLDQYFKPKSQAKEQDDESSDSDEDGYNPKAPKTPKKE